MLRTFLETEDNIKSDMKVYVPWPPKFVTGYLTYKGANAIISITPTKIGIGHQNWFPLTFVFVLSRNLQNWDRMFGSVDKCAQMRFAYIADTSIVLEALPVNTNLVVSKSWKFCACFVLYSRDLSLFASVDIKFTRLGYENAC